VEVLAACDEGPIICDMPSTSLAVWTMPVQVAFPIGKLSSLQGVTKDLTFMEDLMKEIRSNKVGQKFEARLVAVKLPAHC
jgi:hypothetical protein